MLANVRTPVIVGLALMVTMGSALAVTCDDVRALSTAQQSYWSQRLHISAYQRHLIWVACYRDYHAHQFKTVRW